MKIFRTIPELRAELAQSRIKKLSIGFVPTMGALHEGHISLIRKSVSENPVTVCSIFVNPTQFTNTKDLENYPRTEKLDIKKLKASKCTIVFTPSIEEMYPKTKLLDIDFGKLETIMEGAYRPGHFKGMATVVKKLFEIVEPDIAYFGEKDFQQLTIVKNMVKKLNIPVQINGCPTIRERDGLAMSSRNIHLTKKEREEASVIYLSLELAKKKIGKAEPIKKIRQHIIEKIEESGLFKVQYFEIVNANMLQRISKVDQKIPIRGCIAVLASKTRLIDNLMLN